MFGKAGRPAEARRRPGRSTPVIWTLYSLVVICEITLARGFLLAATADSAAFTGGLAPKNLAGLVDAWLPMVTAWTAGAFHPFHLEAWEKSSLPVEALAFGAAAVSVYLRRRRWPARLPAP